MSHWTHIVAVMHVETFAERVDIEQYVRDLLKDAPVITGSEGPAFVFVNAQTGHNISTTQACEICPWKDSDDGEGNCAAPEDFDCPSGEFQSRVVITVCGDLRDRMKAETHKEWKAFQKYIFKTLKFGYRNVACSIQGY